MSVMTSEFKDLNLANNEKTPKAPYCMHFVNETVVSPLKGAVIWKAFPCLDYNDLKIWILSRTIRQNKTDFQLASKNGY